MFLLLSRWRYTDYTKGSGMACVRQGTPRPLALSQDMSQYVAFRKQLKLEKSVLI
jgi:hypothetical protein